MSPRAACHCPYQPTGPAPLTRARHIGRAWTVALCGHVDLDSAQIDNAQFDSAQMKRIRMTTDHEAGARSDTDRQDPTRRRSLLVYAPAALYLDQAA